MFNKKFLICCSTLDNNIYIPDCNKEMKSSMSIQMNGHACHTAQDHTSLDDNATTNVCYNVVNTPGTSTLAPEEGEEIYEEIAEDEHYYF